MQRRKRQPIGLTVVIADNVARLLNGPGEPSKQIELAASLREYFPDRRWESDTVSRLVNGKRDFAADELVALSLLFGVSLTDLLINRTGRAMALGIDLFRDEALAVLLVPDSQEKYWWQWAVFKDTTRGLYDQGELADVPRLEARDMNVVADDEPFEPDSDLNELYYETLGRTLYDGIVGDHDFWIRRRRIRTGHQGWSDLAGSTWGTWTYSRNPLVEEVAHIVNEWRNE